MTFWGIWVTRASQVRESLKSESESNGGGSPCRRAFSSTFAEKYVLEKEIFMGSLATGPFFKFLTLWGFSGGTLWKGFCTNIDCSLEKPISHKLFLPRD